MSLIIINFCMPWGNIKISGLNEYSIYPNYKCNQHLHPRGNYVFKSRFRLWKKLFDLHFIIINIAQQNWKTWGHLYNSLKINDSWRREKQIKIDINTVFWIECAYSIEVERSRYAWTKIWWFHSFSQNLLSYLEDQRQRFDFSIAV